MGAQAPMSFGESAAGMTSQEEAVAISCSGVPAARDRRRDELDGGTGRDRARVDRRDIVRRVEVVRTPAP
jgi:hypothetical protein